MSLQTCPDCGGKVSSAAAACPHCGMIVSSESATDWEIVEAVVTDVRMPFGSMVVFMVKWAIAAIPAFLIIGVIWLFFMAVAVALGDG